MQHAPPTKTEYDYLNGWIKKKSHNQKKKKNQNKKTTTTTTTKNHTHTHTHTNKQKKTTTTTKKTPKHGEPQRYSWGTQKKKKNKWTGVGEGDSRHSGGYLMNVLSPATVCLLVGCLTSQQHASVSQGRIRSDNFTCCHTEIEVADQTFYLTQSQYSDTGPTSPSTDPTTPGAWQGSHWSANF